MTSFQEYSRKNKVLIFLFFFCVFNPFVSPVPISTDVQLPVFALAFILFILAIFNGRALFDRSQIALLVLAFWTMVYIGLDGSFNPRYRLGLPLGLLVLFVVQIYWHHLTLRMVYVAILFNSFGIFLHKFIPAHFIPIAELVTREIKIKEIDLRGASGFCPEPGHASAIFVILMLTLVYFYEKGELRKKYFYLNGILLVFCILMTQSAVGILFMILLFGVYFLLKFNIKIKVTSALILVIMIIYANSTDYFVSTRAGDLIITFIYNPLQILRLDGSLAERAAGISFGLYGLREWLFGFGGGSYANIAPLLDEKYNVMDYYYKARDQTQQTVTAFGTYTLEFGIIFWLFLTILIYYCFAFSATAIASILIASLFILASFSITFPGTWYLLALSTQYQRKQGK